MFLPYLHSFENWLSLGVTSRHLICLPPHSCPILGISSPCMTVSMISNGDNEDNLYYECTVPLPLNHSTTYVNNTQLCNNIGILLHCYCYHSCLVKQTGVIFFFLFS